MVTKEIKKVILEQDLSMVNNTLYSLTIKAKIAKDIGSETGQLVTELEKLQKTRDKYLELIKELDEPTKK